MRIWYNRHKKVRLRGLTEINVGTGVKSLQIWDTPITSVQNPPYLQIKIVPKITSLSSVP